MKKRMAGVFAVLLGMSLLLCSCRIQEDMASDNGQKTKVSSEEIKRQAWLQMIQPAAYSNAEGLNLEKGAYISVIGKGESGPFWNTVEKGAEAAKEDLNRILGYTGKEKIKVTYSGSGTENNVEEQINILDEEIARYPIAVGIAIADVKAGTVQFDMAAENDIPIIAFDSGNSYEGLMSMVATDNEGAAGEAAAHMAEELPEGGSVLVFASDFRAESLLLREKGFQTAAAEYPNLPVAGVYYLNRLEEQKEGMMQEIENGTYEKPEGVEKTEEGVQPDSISQEMIMDYLLKKNPEAKGCFIMDGSAVPSVLEAMERTDTDLSVIGFDVTKRTLKELEAGKIKGLIVQNPFGMGYATVIAAARAYLGLGNEAEVNTGYTWVTKKNLKEKSVQQILY